MPEEVPPQSAPVSSGTPTKDAGQGAPRGFQPFPQTPPSVPLREKDARQHGRLKRLAKRWWILLPLLGVAVGLVLLLRGRLPVTPVSPWRSLRDLPAEAAAFWAVRPDTPQGKQLLPPLLAPFHGISPDTAASARNVVRVMLRRPGSASAHHLLLLEGVSEAAVRPQTSLETQSYRRWTAVGSAEAHQSLATLKNKTLSTQRAFQSLLEEVPGDEIAVGGLQASPSPLLLRGMFPGRELPEQLLTFMVRPSTSEGRVRVRVRFQASPSSAPAVTGGKQQAVALAGRLPASARLVSARSPAFFSALSTASDSPAELQPLRQALQDHAPSVKLLLDAQNGPGVLAVLPSAAGEVLDGALLLPVTVSDSVKEALPIIERIAPAFAPALTGLPFPQPVFADREHNGVHIRYVNFGSPARTVDYAVIGDLLLFATSRESMFALLDAVAGGNALATDDAFLALQEFADGEWVFYRPREEAPEDAGGIIPLAALLLRPATNGLWEGEGILPPP